MHTIAPGRQRSRAYRGAVSLPVLLLAGVIVLAAVLAYQAQDAARSQRVTAENTLRDYSAFGTNEFSRELGVHSQTLLRLSFSRLLGGLNSQPTRLATAAAVARDVAWQRRERIEPYWCACLDSVRYYFALDVASGALDVSGPVSPPTGSSEVVADRSPASSSAASSSAVPSSALRSSPVRSSPVLPSPGVERWVRDTLLAYATGANATSPMTLTTFGATDGRSRRFDLAITNDSYGFIIGELEGHGRLLAYVVSRDLDGNALAVYGYEADPEGWLHPLMDLTVDEERLLPPSLLHGRKNDEVLSVFVEDALGHELYRSSPEFAEKYAAVDTLSRRFGSLRVHLAVVPGIAEQLLVGGLPSSRLPLLVALFLLTTGLAVVALLQMRRQQELARMRSDFVAGVSHELRTPLAQIRWFAELLRLGRLRSPEERERSLRIIDQEARRLAFLVENVLNFSRNGSRTARLRPEVIQLGPEVREIVDGFAPLVESRRIAIRTVLEGDVSALVDRAAFRQILLNLLDNAAKYGPPSQTVVVGVARAGADRARLWVEDEGPGVPEAERVRVWQPFYRAERDRGSVATGSGIGLAVVGDLVALQHGRHRIESGTSGGARIVIEFPSPAAMPAGTTEPVDDGEPDADADSPEPADTAGGSAS